MHVHVYMSLHFQYNVYKGQAQTLAHFNTFISR